MSRVRMVLRRAGAVFAGVVLVCAFAGQTHAKVEDDTVYLGAAISLTGKYSTNGAHTQRGYDLAIERINAAGGLQLMGKATSWPLPITTTNQHLRGVPSLLSG